MKTSITIASWFKHKWDLLNKKDIPQRIKNQRFLIIALEWQSFVLSAVLIVLNMKRQQPQIAIMLASALPFFIVATYLTVVKNNPKPAVFMYMVFFIFIFTYAVCTGANDGAGLLWIFILPILVLAVFDLKTTLIIDGWFTMLFLVLSLSPKLRSILPYTYPEGKFMRYLFMFLSDVIISFIIMTGNIESLLYQNDYASRLQDALNEERAKVNGISMQTILAINKAVEAKDQYTGDHSKRVAVISRKIAEQLGWNKTELKRIYDIALLHDIGKIGINCDVLTKTTPLSDEEYASIRQHTIIGGDILQGTDFIPGIADVVRHHHEFWDGTGYPDGLSGNDIPIESRIITVADSFDAMLHGRSYRVKMPVSQIMEDLMAKSGTRYDPAIVSIMIALCNSGEITDEIQEASDE